ncbi:MAG TPA: type II toxin-antitoxin system death-on-curing family toxin [Lactobacillus sp.]|uniref:Death-on-curing family protein n=1 Tax=Secundilactobacillus silagincola TaxID=1714681 RepID=A0A1Z5J3N7_9LACO|nr:type II toxin-antitoxin system death-on-curing family toxin [Secundilactobacillus silagincola]GAX08358.1 death-on-curing family protein [Secundilactobacillus silagincola]HBF75742.1 type II toxin-antitoxin system death-on-curing family toxin [Lactobacillus sp.]
MTVRYLTEDEVIAINQYIIKQADEGSAEVVDPDGLKSIIEQPQMVAYGHETYPTIWLKAACLLQKLTKNLVFNEGNKRTAYLSTVIFLRLNHIKFELSGSDAKDFMWDEMFAPDKKDRMINVAPIFKLYSKRIES